MENQQLVTPEIAQRDLGKWLDNKKIPQKKREQHQDALDTIIDGLVSGSLIIGEDCTIEHKLSFPLQDDHGNVVKASLTYKPRITIKALSLRLKNVAPSNVDGRLLAYAACITGNSPELLGNLDTVDQGLVYAIVSFFL